ncbi:ABC transporter permease [Sandaracinus amylolyticus]|nr:ABC transporter permease subunit [Sandaracinus amylolyticus]
MQNTLTIAGRQFRAYFNGPVAYIVIALSLLIVGFLFWEPFFLMNRASVREMFRFMSWMLIVGAPAITMGLLADERRSGTLELLITMPVRESEVILGKFLGAVGLLAVLLLCSLPYPISVAQLGSLDWGQVATGYLGLFLQGCAMIALGIAASSFTENQLVAFFVATFVFLFMTVLGFYLPLWSGSFASFLEWITFDFHRESMGRGVIDTRDVIYFVSFATIFLMLAFRALESRRWS